VFYTERSYTECHCAEFSNTDCTYADCCYTEWHYAEFSNTDCTYADCCYTELVILTAECHYFA